MKKKTLTEMNRSLLAPFIITWDGEKRFTKLDTFTSVKSRGNVLTRTNKEDLLDRNRTRPYRKKIIGIPYTLALIIRFRGALRLARKSCLRICPLVIAVVRTRHRLRPYLEVRLRRPETHLLTALVLPFLVRPRYPRIWYLHLTCRRRGNTLRSSGRPLHGSTGALAKRNRRNRTSSFQDRS